MYVRQELPCPLEQATTSGVEATRRHHVTSWQQFYEEIEGWVLEHLIGQKATVLPERSYGFRDGKFGPTFNERNQEAIHSCFQNQERFEQFRAGRDYSFGLADVTD